HTFHRGIDREEQKSIHRARRERIEDHLLPVLLVPDTGKHHRIAMWACRLLSPLQHGGKVGVTHIGNGQDEQARSTGTQCTCSTIRAIAELACRAQNRFLSPLPNAASSFPPKNKRNG